jgi:hypothetical protein
VGDILCLDALELCLMTQVREGRQKYVFQHNKMPPQIHNGVTALFSVQPAEPKFGLGG